MVCKESNQTNILEYLILAIQTTNIDPDQTAPTRALWSESTLFCYRDVLNGLAEDIADNI